LLLFAGKWASINQDLGENIIVDVLKKIQARGIFWARVLRSSLLYVKEGKQYCIIKRVKVGADEETRQCE